MEVRQIYADKGRAFTESAAVELGTTLLRAGYTVRVKREKRGTQSQWVVEYAMEFGIEKAAPSVTSTESGGAKKNNPSGIISPKGNEVNANS